MSKHRWEQLAASGGIAYVVLQLIAQGLIQIGGAEPSFNAPAGEIVILLREPGPTTLQYR